MVALFSLFSACVVLASTSQVFASPAPAALTLVHHFLTARQLAAPNTTASPASCETQCNASTTAITNCNDSISCICTNANINAFAQCFDCSSAADPTFQISTGQNAIDSLASSCKSAGFNINDPKLNNKSNGIISVQLGSGFATLMGLSLVAFTAM